MIDSVSAERHWQVVVDCLVELHGKSPRLARHLVDDYLRSMTEAFPGENIDLIYHEEQFDLANGLAGQSLDWAQHRAAYEHIVQRHYPWVAARQ